MRLVNLTRKTNRMLADGPFAEALREFGELEVHAPAIHLDEAEQTALIRSADVLLTMWDSLPVPAAVIADPGRLRYVCNITGSLRGWVPLALVERGIPVTNWGDAPAQGVAEAAVTLLLSCLKDVVWHHQEVAASQTGERHTGWHRGGTLDGLVVGVYGLGVIGRAFVRMIQPFNPVILGFDPYVAAADWPAGVARVNSLEALCRQSQAISLHAGLSEETRGAVSRELLALLPDGGVVVNTARGGLIDQEALFAELATGRLRAGLDVLDGDDALAPGHPARQWPNLLWTRHFLADRGALTATGLESMHRICLDNLARFRDGRPLRFTFDRERWLRST